MDQKTYQSINLQQEMAFEVNRSDGSVTDSFSEDEIDYSPPGFEPCAEAPSKLEPHGLPSKNHRSESWITSMTENACFNGQAIIVNHVNNEMDKQSESFIGNIKQMNHVKTGSLVYLTRFLSDNLDSEHARRQIPDMVVLDALIFSPNFPVTILTMTKESIRNEQECRRYNTYLASWLTETLRDIDASLSVLHGVVDINDDLSQTLDKLRQQKLCFSFADSLTMTPERCRKALLYVLHVLESIEVFPSVPAGIQHDVSLRGSLSVNKTEEYSGVSEEQKTFLQSDRHPSVNSFGTQTAVAVNSTEATAITEALSTSSQTIESFEKAIQPWEAIIFVIVDFAIHCYQIFAARKSEIQGSYEFTEQRGMPVVYLLMEVMRLHRQCYHKQCWYHILGLLMSRVGDIIFVKKHLYSDIGMCVFAAANILYALAFEFRFDKPIQFCIFAVLGTVIFNTFSGNIVGMTYYILACYTMSVCLMAWRALADVDSVSTLTGWKCSGIIGVLCFTVYNVIIGIEISNTPFPGSQVLSMVAYYLAQFSTIVSVLLKYDIIELSEDTKTTSKRFGFMSVMSIVILPCVKREHGLSCICVNDREHQCDNKGASLCEIMGVRVKVKDCLLYFRLRIHNL